MLLLFFLAWIIFNGRITLEIVIFGVVIAIAMFAFVCKFMNYSIKKEKNLYKKMPKICRYIVLLVIEIVKSNLTVCRMILSAKEVTEPAIVHIHTELKKESSKVMLANAITLTPGTITVSLKDQSLLVHCLDKSLADGIENSDFVKMLEEIEGEE